MARPRVLRPRALGPLLLLAALLAASPRRADAQAARPGRAAPPGPKQGGPARVGRLAVNVSVPGATVYVDGVAVGTSPIDGAISVAAGPHTLKVSKPGHAEFIDAVNVGANALTTVEVELVPFDAVVRITTDPPGADVFVDGNLQGQSPLELEIPPGSHTVRVELDGYGPSEKAVQVIAGESYVVPLTLVATLPVRRPRGPGARRPIYKTWWFWAASGAAVVGVTAIAIVAASDDDPLGGADKVVDVKF